MPQIHHDCHSAQKKQTVRCLNDYRPVALTSIITKRFMRIVLSSIKANMPINLNSHKFAYGGNRPTKDPISIALHETVSYMENPNTYVRMPFVNFSSAFNTLLATHKLIHILKHLELCTTICSRISDFLANRPQNVRVGNRVFSASPFHLVYPRLHTCPLLWHYSEVCRRHHYRETNIKGRR